MRLRRTVLSLSLVIVASVLISLVLVHAKEENNYNVTVLASSAAGDADLINGWGIAATGTSPWWVSDQGTSKATLYNGAGVKQGLIVTIPGSPTGIVSYAGTQFLIAGAGTSARFMFASLDGTISAWRAGNLATVKHGQPGTGSVYTGLAILGNTLYTTDFASCEVEAINGTFQEFDTVGGFEDPGLPEGFCPFGIQAIGSSIFVAYAVPEGGDVLKATSRGIVDEFDANGNLITRVAQYGTLNAPWGIAQAPADFGRFGGCLLVGNFGDGLINAYCEDHNGDFKPRGRLEHNDEPIKIDGLWGIGFGNGAASGAKNVLYFAAGPEDETQGAFGKVEVAP